MGHKSSWYQTLDQDIPQRVVRAKSQPKSLDGSEQDSPVTILLCMIAWYVKSIRPHRHRLPTDMRQTGLSDPSRFERSLIIRLLIPRHRDRVLPVLLESEHRQGLAGGPTTYNRTREKESQAMIPTETHR